MMLQRNITRAASTTARCTQRMQAKCKVAPLSVSFRAAGVLRGIVGRGRNGRDKLLKVHDVGEEGILRSGALWVD